VPVVGVDGGFGGFGGWSHAMVALALARAFASFLLAVTSFSMVFFFWMAALARLSSGLAIMAACLASVAAFIGKGNLVYNHLVDNAYFCKCCCPVEFPTVPHEHHKPWYGLH
jgi:hypothetical protein